MTTDKNCQIATVGENIEWIKRGVLLYKTDRLFLLVTDDPKFVAKTEKIKDIFSDHSFESPPMKIEIEILHGNDHLQFVKTLRSLITQNAEDGYNVFVNITAGLRLWQLYGYFVCSQLKKQIKKLFIVNKQTGQSIDLPLDKLSPSEQLFIDTINLYQFKIKELRGYFSRNGKEVSVAYISKTLKKLKGMGLVCSIDKGREKIFTLTKKGEIYLSYSPE